MKSAVVLLACLGCVTLVWSECAPECLQCEDDYGFKCLRCPEGLDPVGSRCTSVVTEDDFDRGGVARSVCMDSNCLDCPGESRVCTACTEGYLIIGGECVVTAPDPCEELCEECVHRPGPYCLNCHSPYTAVGGACTVQCEDTCTRCVDQEGPWCTECTSGYQAADGKCVAIPEPPAQPEPEPPVEPPAAPPAPVECQVPHCAECQDGTADTCLRCDTGFEGDGNNGCRAICRIHNCAECERENGNTCVACKTGYALAADGLCEAPCEVPNCNACMPGRPDVCLACQDPYRRDEHTECVVPTQGCWDTNCAVCENSRKTCDICLLGFRGIEGECIETETNCDEQCLDCYMTEEDGPLCLRCANRMRPVEDECEPDLDDIQDGL